MTNPPGKYKIYLSPQKGKHWGVAKLVKASDSDSDIRGFKSFLPSHIEHLEPAYVPALSLYRKSSSNRKSNKPQAVQKGQDARNGEDCAAPTARDGPSVERAMDGMAFDRGLEVRKQATGAVRGQFLRL